MEVGAETAPFGGIGGRGVGFNDIHCLHLPPPSGIVFQIPGMGPVGVRRRLSSGNTELVESASEMVTYVTGA